MLTFPSGHQPRYRDFTIRAISDETIREGGERAPYGADDARKFALVQAITDAGVTDIDVGSGLTEPAFVRSLVEAQQEHGTIRPDATFSFNLTLKTWEPLCEQLERELPKDYLSQMYVSIGMIEIGSQEQLFERVADRLRALGVGRLRVSLLNAFGITVDEDKYQHLNQQIERARQQGVSLVRINDSVGTLIPDSTAVLAANLVHDNPDVSFYLHGHNDRGLGTANSLTSVFHGFQMIEGGVAEVGNRAGLAAIESIAAVFQENNIAVDASPLDIELLKRAAQFSEEVFLTAPDPFRPVSGFLVDNENAGIVNVPDYLGVSRQVQYYLNRIGVFPIYLKQILIESGLDESLIDDRLIDEVYERLCAHMDSLYLRKREQFDRLSHEVKEFYREMVRLQDVRAHAEAALAERVGAAR